MIESSLATQQQKLLHGLPSNQNLCVAAAAGHVCESVRERTGRGAPPANVAVAYLVFFAPEERHCGNSNGNSCGNSYRAETASIIVETQMLGGRHRSVVGEVIAAFFTFSASVDSVLRNPSLETVHGRFCDLIWATRIPKSCDQQQTWPCSRSGLTLSGIG